MEIKIKTFNFGFEPTTTKMICVPKHKYADVHLCFDFKNGNIQFASLSMNDGTYSDKESQFESLSKLGYNIANAWNEKYNLK